MTHEEMLAAYLNDTDETLAHFNPFHSSKDGRFAKKGSGTITLSPRGEQIAKRAAIAGGAMAGVSALATVGNAIGAQRGLDMMGYGDKLSKSAVVRAGASKAGKVAVAAALVTIGGHMVKDYMTQGEPKKKKPDAQ